MQPTNLVDTPSQGERKRGESEGGDTFPTGSTGNNGAGVLSMFPDRTMCLHLERAPVTVFERRVPAVICLECGIYCIGSQLTPKGKIVHD